MTNKSESRAPHPAEERLPAGDELIHRCERMVWRTLPFVLHTNRQLTQMHSMTDLQLTPAQFHILRNIHRGAKSISDIAACEKVSLPAISRPVEGLVNMGMVERTRDADDRRSITLALTEYGQQTWNQLLEKSHQNFAEKLKVLSPQEIETIIEGLELLYSAFASEEAECLCETTGGKDSHA